MRLLFQRKAVRIQALTQQQWRALMTQQCDCNCKDSKNELSIEIIKAKRNSMPACWGAGITNSGTLIFLIPERSVLKNRYATTNKTVFSGGNELQQNLKKQQGSMIMYLWRKGCDLPLHCRNEQRQIHTKQ